MRPQIDINHDRLRYLMKMFDVDEDFLLTYLHQARNNRRKKKTEPHNLHDEIFRNPIKVSTLKDINNIFKKELWYYTDPDPPPKESECYESSILFRKETHTKALHLGDKEYISRLEDHIANLSALSKLTELSWERILKPYHRTQNPQEVAYELHPKMFPSKNQKNDRAFLQDFINTLAAHNILVLEHIEPWNKKEKTTIEGCFLAPYTIGLKRLSVAYKREIFTLAHELGHYLLSSEKLDPPVYVIHPSQKEDSSHKEEERWCNEFAFYLLLGKDGYGQVEKLSKEKISTKNQELKTISDSFHLSRLALFTHFFLKTSITEEHYKEEKKALKDEYQNFRENRAPSTKGFARQQLLYSAMEKTIYEIALYEGVIEEPSIKSSILGTLNI